MRDLYHRELDGLLDLVVTTGDAVIEMLEDALRALISHDVELADRVRHRDEEIDTAYESLQHGLLRIMATQAPVAGDLRFVSALMHVGIHLERMGDYAASVAKMGKLAAPLLDDADLAQQLHEMGVAAREVAGASFRAFTNRDLELARDLGRMDLRVNKLNIGIFHRLVRLAADDDSRLEWATHMILVARNIERYGDHAVDIGEQTIFAVTGTTVELSSNEPGASTTVAHG